MSSRKHSAGGNQVKECPDSRSAVTERPGVNKRNRLSKESKMRTKLLVALTAVLGAAGTAQAAHCGACRYPAWHCHAEQSCMPEVRYKVCYQTVIEEHTKTCYRPVYQTVMRECR